MSTDETQYTQIMSLEINSITGLLHEVHGNSNTTPQLSETEKIQLAVSNATKEAILEGHAYTYTRDKSRTNITIAYIDNVSVEGDLSQSLADIIVLVEGGEYGGIGAVQLPLSCDIDLSADREYSDNNSRETLIWSTLFSIAIDNEPLIIRCLWNIAKDSTECGTLIKPLFEQAIRDDTIHMQTVLNIDHAREN